MVKYSGEIISGLYKKLIANFNINNILLLRKKPTIVKKSEDKMV